MGEETAEVHRMHFEEQAYQAGYTLVAGVDEAGRGPLAGALFAAAVILPPRIEGLKGLRDSKKLTVQKRESLYTEIFDRALNIGLAQIEVREIDRVNILQASLLGMKQAVERLSPAPHFILVDGPWEIPLKLKLPQKPLVKGDDRSLSIAAASVIAKVSRDRYMKELDELYPHYGFARHKGYGTAEHLEALKRYGPCPQHRLTFKGVTRGS